MWGAAIWMFVMGENWPAVAFHQAPADRTFTVPADDRTFRAQR